MNANFVLNNSSSLVLLADQYTDYDSSKSIKSCPLYTSAVENKFIHEDRSYFYLQVGISLQENEFVVPYRFSGYSEINTSYELGKLVADWIMDESKGDINLLEKTIIAYTRSLLGKTIWSVVVPHSPYATSKVIWNAELYLLGETATFSDGIPRYYALLGYPDCSEGFSLGEQELIELPSDSCGVVLSNIIPQLQEAFKEYRFTWQESIILSRLCAGISRYLPAVYPQILSLPRYKEVDRLLRKLYIF